MMTNINFRLNSQIKGILSDSSLGGGARMTTFHTWVKELFFNIIYNLNTLAYCWKIVSVELFLTLALYRFLSLSKRVKWLLFKNIEKFKGTSVFS